MKAPASQVTVHLPAAPASAAAGPAGMPAASPASFPAQPTYYAQPVAASVAGGPVMMTAAAPTNNLVAARVQTTSTSRDRVALGLDWVRIPIPFPRLMAVPGPQRVVTEAEYTSAPQAAVAPAMIAQAVALPAQPTYTAMMTPGPAAFTGGFQAMPAPTAVAVPSPAAVAVQTVAPPLNYYTVPTGPVVSAVPAQPAVAAIPVTPAAIAIPTAPPSCAAENRPASRESVAEMNRHLNAVEKLLREAGARSAGVPLPSISTVPKN